MNRVDFATLCRQKTVILDGATGTELIRHGMPSGVSPEQWILSRPDAIQAVQNGYRASGSDLVYAPTFSGNRFKMAEFGLEKELGSINARLVQIARSAAENAVVFGDLSPTGQFMKPAGELDFEDCVAVYREQAQALLEGGVDGFTVETMLDLQEARAAVLAIRSCSQELPVMVTMTFDQSGRTLSGNTPEGCLVTLQSLGIDAFGCNCSTGPEDMAKLVARMKPFARIPLIAKPNAGLPEFVNGRTVFSMNANEFGLHAATLIQAGANLIGGCCGTTPEHIASLSANAAKLPVAATFSPDAPDCISSARTVLPFTAALNIGRMMSGENPDFVRSVKEGAFEVAFDLAMDQADADVLLIGGIESTRAMEEVLMQVQQVAMQPLCFDLDNPEVLEKALRLFTGRALVCNNSPVIMEVAARYGSILI